MSLPLAFVAVGKPSSVNGTPAKKHAWKAIVNVAASAAVAAKLPPWVGGPYPGRTTVKLFYFPATLQYIDVDNGIKQTIDGMNPPVLLNDKDVIRVLAERIRPVPGAGVVVPIGAAFELVQAAQIAAGTWAAGTPAKHATAVKVQKHMSTAWSLW